MFPFRDIKLWWCRLSPEECGIFLSLCLYCDLTDGSPSSSVSDGMFRKPSEGQSLISYLSEQDFGSCADLEKVSQSSPQHSLKALPLCSEPSFSAFCRRTPISAFPSPSLLPLSWWSTTCGIRRRVRRRETATVRSSSSSRRFAWGGNRSDAAACCRPQPLSAVRPHLRTVKWNHASLKASVKSLSVLFCDISLILILAVLHSTDSGGSRRSSQESCHGLSDSGSAEEVEECELQGIQRDGGNVKCLDVMSKNLTSKTIFESLWHCMSNGCIYHHNSYSAHLHVNHKICHLFQLNESFLTDYIDPSAREVSTSQI